jgi:class 3 adenylate cyclase/tetratricopeptide (TPR) repeat protein
LPLLVESAVTRFADGGRSVAPRTARVRGIADVVQRGLAEVDHATVELLEVAAVLGEPAGSAQLAALVDRAPAVVEEQLEATGRAHLLRREGEVWRFTHPLVRASVLDRLSGAARRAIHRSIAERLGRARRDTGPLAEHLLVQMAGHLVRARPDVDDALVANLAARAGRIAMRWGAWHEASELLTAAAEARPDGHRHFAAAQAAYLDHDVDRCERHVALTVADADRSRDDDLRARAALLLVRLTLGERPLRPGRRPDTALLEQALQAPAIDVTLAVEAHATLAEAWFVSGETDRALDTVALAGELAELVPDGPAIDKARFRLELAEGLHRMTLLELAEAEACFDRAARHAVAARNTLDELAALSRRCLLRLLRGDVQTAADELGALRDRGLALRYWGEAGFATALLALAHVIAGDRDASTVVDQAAQLHRRSGHAYSAVVLAPARAALRARTTGVTVTTEDAPTSSVLAALAAVDADDTGAARTVVTTARWRHGLVGRVTLQNLGIPVALVEVGDLLDDPVLVAAGRPALEAAHEARVVAVMGWPATVPRLLATAARHDGDLDVARRHVENAVDMARREALPVEVARAQLELARILAAQGSPSTAVEPVLSAAAATFGGLSFHGWAARCARTAGKLGVRVQGDGEGASLERTILTTDIVGSTATNARLGDAFYFEQLRIHDRLIRGRLHEYAGEEIKHTGDGINAAFDEPLDACRCALAVQSDFARWRLDEPDLALEIRCGIAKGRLIPSGGDFFGLVQAEAARLCALSPGGEVLVSGDVEGDVRAIDIVHEHRGSELLRGLPAKTEVYRLRLA